MIAPKNADLALETPKMTPKMAPKTTKMDLQTSKKPLQDT